ncbi:PfkB family carbohydrate kinase [Microbispora oryzae]|uniref:PfkB family carbohydrate kinase n=1 Tax=Microbispora oryzae TaxID=2806554 RepID=UPI001AEC1A9C|nr:PfkB family carbohydrate kinase [Microbispora oryzae]
MTGPLVVIGDSLLDVDVEGDADRLCPDAPAPVVDVHAERCRPGGAGLAALLAARDGAEVVLITALGDDPSGRALDRLLASSAEIVRMPLHGTTARKTRVRARGQTLVRVDTGDGRPAFGGLSRDRAVAALRSAGAVLVADYGRGVADLHRDLLTALLRRRDVPVVWDPHPRGSPPVPGCALVTPSEAEARALCAGAYGTPGRAAERLVRDLEAAAVAVTLGERGTVLARRAARSSRIPAVEVAGGAVSGGADACGAGDRFAAEAAVALGRGEPVEDAVARAVEAAGRFVADGGAAGLRLSEPAAGPSPAASSAVSSAALPVASSAALSAALPPGASAFDVADAVRAAGGRLIATGGCFDLLHAGHVSLLRRARALGDALVVCLNSDESVRRLKGPRRPVVAEHDRSEVLRALDCVDAVLIFGADTPSEVIARLRPDVWVKGGDYSEWSMPEADAVRRAGGEVVILPTVAGYSTTGLIAAVQAAS